MTSDPDWAYRSCHLGSKSSSRALDLVQQIAKTWSRFAHSPQTQLEQSPSVCICCVGLNRMTTKIFSLTGVVDDATLLDIGHG